MNNRKTILVTGGAGFIGLHLISALKRKYAGTKIVIVDKFGAGSIDKKIAERITYVSECNICNLKLLKYIFLFHQPDLVFHLAAESHVDRSIDSPLEFFQSNIIGTTNVIECVRNINKPVRLVHVSTDEVYGDIAGESTSTESDALRPSSPYSASKAGSDLAVLAAVRTYGIDACVTRCCNNYGTGQDTEKLIPKIIHNLLSDKTIPVYGDGKQRREWIHVDDHCNALITVGEKGKKGEIYNIGTSIERPNIEIIRELLRIIRGGNAKMDAGFEEAFDGVVEFVDDRLGHDVRYALDSTKIKRDLGWAPAASMNSSLSLMVDAAKRNELLGY
tara:strand:+ start:3367 stop:4362 length:996 start_codon:yes stop_codon:yes gene_type:complete